MKFRPPFPKTLPSPEELGLVEAIDSYGQRVRRFYDSRARWHRRFYRFSGILVILTGAGLPVLTSLDYPAKSLFISLAGMFVAALTGLRAFYRWDQSWVLLRNTEMVITEAYWVWKGSPANNPDVDDATTRQAKQDAAYEFVKKLGQLRQREATMFFKDMSYPTTDGHASGVGRNPEKK
jgi:hypothetical protein